MINNKINHNLKKEKNRQGGAEFNPSVIAHNLPPCPVIIKEEMMCQFFSCISNGKGKIRYFNADIRQQIRDGKLSYSEDSHDSLCSYFKTEIPLDRANKYEYDPTTGEFTIDQINAKDDEGFPLDDSKQVEAFCRKLDFNEVVPNWSYIANVLKRLKTYKPNNPITATKMPDEQIMRGVLVRIKASVGDSVWDSVRASVGGQSAICGYHAINKFLKLGIEHPAFDLVELGVIVVQTGGMVKVYGKKGKFLGEFRE